MSRDETLGMPYGTAMNQLRKQIMFSLLIKTEQDSCFRCEKKIECVRDLSVEHKKPWRGKDPTLFWDLENIAFSHLSCNSGAHHQANAIGKRVDGKRWCPDCKQMKDDKTEWWPTQDICKKCKNKRNNEWRYAKGLRRESGWSRKQS